MPAVAPDGVPAEGKEASLGWGAGDECGTGQAPRLSGLATGNINTGLGRPLSPGKRSSRGPFRAPTQETCLFSSVSGDQAGEVGGSAVGEGQDSSSIEASEQGKLLARRRGGAPAPTKLLPLAL